MSNRLPPHRKRSRNPSPPRFASRGHNSDESAPRKIRNVASGLDHAELQKYYMFVPSSQSTTWQERMVNHYHSHLYKEYVLADLTRAPSLLGLRWRTQQEVKSGRGHATCGNKHCPGGREPSSIEPQSLVSSYYQSPQPESSEQEEKLLAKLMHGVGLHDYEVPFTYTEQGETKTELVKLRLCLRCSPLLFKGGALEARRARSKRDDDGDVRNEAAAGDHQKPAASSDTDVSVQAAEQRKRTNSDGSTSSSDHEDRRRHHRRSKHQKRKKRRKK